MRVFFSSACSDFFRDAFKRMQPSRSVVQPMAIFLRGVSVKELQSIMEFMYQVRIFFPIAKVRSTISESNRFILKLDSSLSDVDRYYSRRTLFSLLLFTSVKLRLVTTISPPRGPRFESDFCEWFLARYCHFIQA